MDPCPRPNWITQKFVGAWRRACASRLDQSIEDLRATAGDAAKVSAAMKATAMDRTLAYLMQVPTGTDREGWLDRIRERARSAAASAEQARIASDGQLFRADQQVRDACRPLQGLSRLQLCESAVVDPTSGLLARLGADTPVLGFGISDQVTPIDLSLHRTDLLTADGSISNLTGGIHAVLESLKSTPPRAVVLLSDGRLTDADTDGATFAALQAIPIYTVGAATRSGLKDLSITNAIVPLTAIVGDTITLNAELRSFGIRGVTTTVTVTGGGPGKSRPISFPDDRTINLSFNRRFTTAGMQRLTLEIYARCRAN